MPRDFHRSHRVEEQVQRVLSEVIRVHSRDPRLATAIITDVTVSRDLSVAKVYFTSLETGHDPSDLNAAFSSAAGFLRSQLAQQLTVRNVPELRFIYDDSSERGAALEQLIDDAVAKDRQDSDE